MNQSFRFRVSRLVLPSLAAAALTGSLIAAPSYAAVSDNDVTATFSRDGNGLTGVVPDDAGKFWPAGDHYLKLADGTELEVYCIDFANTEVEKAGEYKATAWPVGDLSADDLATVTDIVTRHTKMGTPSAKTGWEEAATQTAVWSITNDVAYDTIPNAEFRDRVDEILSDADGTNVKAPALSYSIDGKKSVTGSGPDAKDVVEAALSSNDGGTIGAQKVEFSVDGQKQEVTTDATGKARLELPTAPEARTVEVSYTAQVPAGVVFSPVSGKQPMISATPFTVADQVSVKVDATAAAQTPPKTTKPKAAPKPTATVTKKDPIPTDMPHTGGFPLFSGLLGAGALTGLGLWGRKRFGKR